PVRRLRWLDRAFLSSGARSASNRRARFLGLRACLAVLPRQGLARPPPPPRRGASNHASQPPPCPRHMLLAARVTRRPGVQPVTLGRVQDADNHRPVVFKKSFKAAPARRASQRRRPARDIRDQGRDGLALRPRSPPPIPR